MGNPWGLIVTGLMRHLRSCERAAYPKPYRQLQDVRTWADLRDYCEGEPRVWTWEGGYCLATDRELVDLASTRAVTLEQLRALLADLAVHFGGRAVVLDARAATSWPLLVLAARRGYVEILSSAPWQWAGEVFHEATVRFLVKP